MPATNDLPSSSPRTLGLPAAAAVVVASMVGTGIFTTTGLLLGALGSPGWVLLAWLAGGVVALAGALIYAELGAGHPRAGGEYAFLSRAFSPGVGFVAGMVSLFVGFAAPTAASAIAFARYARALLPDLPETPVAAGLILLATALHATDLPLGGRAQTALTATKLFLITGFVLAALGTGRMDTTFLWSVAPGTSGAFDPGAFAVALVFVSYSYTGWNAAAYLGAELRSPERTLPRALLLGTVTVTVLYLALNLVFVMAAPAGDLAGVVEIGHHAALALLGERAGRMVSALIGLALASSVSALVLAGPRVVVAMAEDGLLPRSLAARGARGAPVRAVVLQAAVALGVLATASFDRILYAAGFLLSLVAAATVAGAVRLRLREPGATRPFRAPGGWVTPAVFLGVSCWMAVHAVMARPRDALAGTTVLALGAVVYGIRRRAGR